MKQSTLIYHLTAFLVVAIWGSTFVCTKILLVNGLTAAQIFTLRFIIAYVLLLAFSLTRRSFRCWADTWRDELIMAARTSVDQSYRKATYKQCLEEILDWAVEVPVYQRQNAIIYSPERVNADTFTPDVTTYYPWLNEIDKVELN